MENKDLLEELKKLNDNLSSSFGFLLSLDEKLDRIKFGTALVLMIASGILGFLIANHL